MAKVLVVGRGGREAALAYALSRSPGVEVVVVPGNDGMRAYAVTEPGVGEAEAVRLARALRPALVVIGPEAPLAEGLADALREEGVSVFGPSAAAARIETSKLHAKDVMAAAGVPRLPAVVLDSQAAAKAAAAEASRLVLKADGLRQGKGVVVVEGEAEAEAAYLRLAAGGGAVFAEPFRTGREVSLFALTDGQHLRLLPAAQDFKRAWEGDRGPNTGGMGAVAPVLAEAEAEALAELVLRPVVKELARRNTPFVGCLYAGLMLTDEGPIVLEYNARFGDPEAEVLLPLLTEDVFELLRAAAEGDLGDGGPVAASGFAAGVVVAAEGYPEAPRLGARVGGLEPVLGEETFVFWAGARRLPDGAAETTGGRVACVVGRAKTPAEAVAKAYRRAGAVSGDGVFLRRDISFAGTGGGAR